MRTKKAGGCRSSSSSRKGQVTIFIIIGIVIVFVFAAVLFFTNQAAITDLEAAETLLTSSTPQAFVSLQVYTENCLAQVSERGLRIMGGQGGWIHPELAGEYSVQDPTEYDGLFLEPQRIPYWHYNSQSNDANSVTFASKRPPLTVEQAQDEGRDATLSMERQLADYVEEGIGDCLQEYTVFQEQGYQVEVGEKTVEVDILTNDVVVRLAQPLDMVQGESEGRFDQFVVRHALALPEIYQLAYNITIAEREQHFLENIALNLVQIYSGIDRDKLPPTTGTTFNDPSTIFWQVEDVRQKFQQMLVSNVPLIRFWSADNFYRHEYPTSDLSGLYQRTSDDMIIPLQGGANYDVRFDYWNWDVFLDINEGESLIRPELAKFSNPLGVIPFNFNIQNYYNTYDFSYPVRVSVEDASALNGEGYSFIFALEGNVVNNRAARTDRIEPEPRVLSASLACDPETWNTEPVRSIVVDSYTKEPVELVTLGFHIPDQDYCVMGQTNTQGVIESKYPAVYGGVIDFERLGYLTGFYPVDTYQFKEQPGIIGYAVAGVTEPVIELHKMKTVKARVQKKELHKCIGNRCFSQGLFGGGQEVYSYTPDLLARAHSWHFSPISVPLDTDEVGALILERVTDYDGEGQQDAFITTIPVQGAESVDVTLVPGTYKVTAFIAKRAPLLIPEQERCESGIGEAITCADLDGCCFDFNEVSMDEFQIGSLKWDTTETYLTITPDELYTADEITFNTLTFNLYGVPESDLVIEDISVAGKMEELSTTLRAQLRPIYR